MNATLALLAAGAGGGLTAAAVVPLSRLAVRWNLTDRPASHKAHHRPTPYLGGLAIILGTVVPAVTLLGVADRRVTAILLAATAVGVLGLIDDLVSLSVTVRLTVESLAATGVVLSGVHITHTGTWLDGALTVVWIVVLTNSFNLLDNMDGTLGAVTTVTAVFLAGVALIASAGGLASLLIILVFACLGFLVHNWPPAGIFMGDSGSLFLGFILVSTATALVEGQTLDRIAAGLLLPVFIAVVDTGVVFLSRIRAGRPPLSGGTDHISHRLRRVGLGPDAVVAMLGVATAVTGALHLAVALGWAWPPAALIGACGAAVIVISAMQGVSGYAPAHPSGNPPKISERLR